MPTNEQQPAIQPGEHYGLANAGWPPASIVRDPDGRYFISRLTDDLRGIRREELSEADAAAWIAADGD